MENGYYYTKDEAFFKELLKDIKVDISLLNEYPNKVYLTLRQHLNIINNRVTNYYTADELLEMEQSIKDAVRDFTDLDINIYLCSGVVVLGEYLDEPAEMLNYEGKRRR